ncbi:MAG TPA: hypothetical protein VFY40_07480, partial [Blastocatellia bacterium]|nr:hypothetical protein [Blastocatellia bacterium]
SYEPTTFLAKRWLHLSNTLQKRAHTRVLYFGPDLKGNRNVKRGPVVFRGKRRLEAFEDWLAQIGAAGQARSGADSLRDKAEFEG